MNKSQLLNLRHWLTSLSLLFAILLSVSCSEEQAPLPGFSIYVSPEGDDANPGIDHNTPVATLEKARERLRASGKLGKVRCHIELSGGMFPLEHPFVLNSLDSGTAKFPLVIRSGDRKARLAGGRQLKADDFVKISEDATLERVHPDAKGNVLELDLAKVGIKHIEAYPDKFADNGGIFELFLNNKRLPLSRYPNNFGKMTMGKILQNGGGQEKPGNWKDYYGDVTPEQRKLLEVHPRRPSMFTIGEEHIAAHHRWAKVLDRGVWLKGYWRVVWGNDAVRVAEINTTRNTVTLGAHINGGIGNKYHRPDGAGTEVYWLMNLLEEVDQPGEWAVDFKDKKLYLFPPVPLADADILISDMKSPIISLKGAQHVILEGLTVEGSLGDGVHIEGGSHNKVIGCTVRNVTKHGIRIDGGKNHEVRSSDLYALGASGISLSGGDSTKTPRIPAGHLVINNDIHHFGEIERIYAPGVAVGFGVNGNERDTAVGIRVAHNVIHHCPHAGVLFHGFDHVFEYNEVFQFAMVSNDIGAFYSFAKEGEIANTTLRHNFMHSSPEGDGIYFDFHANRPTIVGNIAYRIGPQSGTYKSKRGCGFLVKNFGGNPIDFRNNIAIDCKHGYNVNEEPGSTITQNVAAGCDHASRKIQVHTMNSPLAPGFNDLLQMDLSLKKNAAIFTKVSGFKNIPFSKIGLFEDAHRKSLPVYRKGAAAWAPDGSSPGYEILDRE